MIYLLARHRVLHLLLKNGRDLTPIEEPPPRVPHDLHMSRLMITFTSCFTSAGLNQQTPMHQLRMKPFRPFWGWTKNTFSLPEIIGFFQPLICPKNFPSLPHTSPLPPPLLPPSWFRAHSITRAQESLKGEHEQPEQEHRKQVREGSRRTTSKCERWARDPQMGGEQEHCEEGVELHAC